MSFNTVVSPRTFKTQTFSISSCHLTFIIPSHFGKVKQPQKLWPMFLPFLAFLKAICTPHFGHFGIRILFLTIEILFTWFICSRFVSSDGLSLPCSISSLIFIICIDVRTGDFFDFMYFT